MISLCFIDVTICQSKLSMLGKNKKLKYSLIFVPSTKRWRNGDYYEKIN